MRGHRGHVERAVQREAPAARGSRPAAARGGRAGGGGGGAKAGAGLDLGNQAHLVHGVDAEAAVDAQLGQQRQAQQRADRVVRQRRRAAQRQPERPRALACARACAQVNSSLGPTLARVMSLRCISKHAEAQGLDKRIPPTATPTHRALCLPSEGHAQAAPKHIIAPYCSGSLRGAQPGCHHKARACMMVSHCVAVMPQAKRTGAGADAVADAVDERAHALVVQVALARAVDRRLLRVHLRRRAWKP